MNKDKNNKTKEHFVDPFPSPMTKNPPVFCFFLKTVEILRGEGFESYIIYVAKKQQVRQKMFFKYGVLKNLNFVLEGWGEGRKYSGEGWHLHNYFLL